MWKKQSFNFFQLPTTRYQELIPPTHSSGSHVTAAAATSLPCLLFISPTSDLNSISYRCHPVTPCRRSQCLSLNRENEDNIIRRPNAAIMRHVMSSHHNPVMCWDSKVPWHCLECLLCCWAVYRTESVSYPFFARPKSRISGVVISGGLAENHYGTYAYKRKISSYT